MTDTVRLNTLKPGDKCLIMEIKATGILSLIHILNSSRAGPVLLQVKDCTIALGRGIANKILVARED